MPKWLSNLATKVLGEPIPATGEVRLILTRIGEYHEDSPNYLTEKGRAQAVGTAARIKRRIGDDPVVVLEAPRPQRPCYTVFTRLLAAQLEAPIDREHFMTFVTAADSQTKAFHSYLFDKAAAFMRRLLSITDRDVLRVVMVVNGSALNNALEDFDGPTVRRGVMGPAHGSEHELRIIYSRLTGEFKERSFLELPS